MVQSCMNNNIIVHHSQAVAEVSSFKHWIANDDERTWRKLKEAMEMSGEPVVARKLYGDTS